MCYKRRFCPTFRFDPCATREYTCEVIFIVFCCCVGTTRNGVLGQTRLVQNHVECFYRHYGFHQFQIVVVTSKTIVVITRSQSTDCSFKSRFEIARIFYNSNDFKPLHSTSEGRNVVGVLDVDVMSFLNLSSLHVLNGLAV